MAEQDDIRAMAQHFDDALVKILAPIVAGEVEN